MIKTVLNIEGMACGMCESHINDAVRNAFSVKKVTSSRRRGTTEILSEEILDEEKLKDVIGRTGYTLKGISSIPYGKKDLFSRG